MAIDLNAIRNEYARSLVKGNTDFLQNFVPMPDKGVVVIRLLSTEGATHNFYVGTRTHKINGKNLHCPMTEDGNGKWLGNCPVCNWYKQLWKEADSVSEAEAEVLQAEARSIKPNARFYYNCIVRTLTNKDGRVETNVGPKIFSTGIKLHNKISRAISGDDVADPLGDVTDPHTGRDLKVVKDITDGKDAFPNYDRSTFSKESPAGTPEEYERWLSNLHDLHSLRKVLSQEELAREVRIHRGLEKDQSTAFDVEKEEENTPVRPATRVQAPPAQRLPVVQPKPAVVEDDEAMADDAFLAKLRSM